MPYFKSIFSISLFIETISSLANILIHKCSKIVHVQLCVKMWILKELEDTVILKGVLLIISLQLLSFRYHMFVPDEISEINHCLVGNVWKFSIWRWQMSAGSGCVFRGPCRLCDLHTISPGNELVFWQNWLDLFHLWNRLVLLYHTVTGITMLMRGPAAYYALDLVMMAFEQ